MDWSRHRGCASASSAAPTGLYAFNVALMFYAPTTSAVRLCTTLDQEAPVIYRGPLEIALQVVVLVHAGLLAFRTTELGTCVPFEALRRQSQEPVVVGTVPVDALPDAFALGPLVPGEPDEAVRLTRVATAAHQHVCPDSGLHVGNCALRDLGSARQLPLPQG